MDSDHIMWNETGMRTEKNYMIYITANCVCKLRRGARTNNFYPQKLHQGDCHERNWSFNFWHPWHPAKFSRFSLNYMHLCKAYTLLSVSLEKSSKEEWMNIFNEFLMLRRLLPLYHIALQKIFWYFGHFSDGSAADDSSFYPQLADIQSNLESKVGFLL